MCLEPLKIHDFILSTKYQINIEIVSLYKKYAPKNRTLILSLYKSMTHKMEHEVRRVCEISKYALG